MKNSYELFGFDFMLTPDGADFYATVSSTAPSNWSTSSLNPAQNRLWLLEANPDPSLEMFGVSCARDIVGDDPFEAVPTEFHQAGSLCVEA